ncbi:hypothetical protein JW921_08810 [Candidatus Fermentibacterales bacterium]|nr:hypothetical protein [Candidatus Fermentibacterales bacterium]
MVRTGLISGAAFLLLAPGSAASGPVDSVLDFLDATRRADGQAVADLLCEDLLALFDSTLVLLRTVASEDGVLARELLERYGLDAEPWEISTWEVPDLIGVVLESRPVLDPSATAEVEREVISMQGRRASVTLSWSRGLTASFELVWEDGTWKLTGTSLMSRWF